MKEVSKTGSNAEKHEYEKEPRGCSEPFVQLKTDHDPDEDGYNKGKPYAREDANGL